MPPRIPEQEQLGPTVASIDPPWVRMRQPEFEKFKKTKAWEEYLRRETELEAQREAEMNREINAAYEATKTEARLTGKDPELAAASHKAAVDASSGSWFEPPKSEEQRAKRLEEIAGWQDWIEKYIGLGGLNFPAYVGFRGTRYFGQPKARAHIVRTKLTGKESDVDVPIMLEIGGEEKRVRVDPKIFTPLPEGWWADPKFGGDPKKFKVAQYQEEMKKRGLADWNAAKEQGFGPQKVFVNPDKGASFYNPETEEYVWVPVKKIQEAANGGLLPESKARHLERLGVEMYGKDKFGAFAAGAQMGGSFHLASLMYKQMLGPKEYKKAMAVGEKEHGGAMLGGEVLGTLPWFFVGGGPISIGGKVALGAGRVAGVARTGGLIGRSARAAQIAQKLGRAPKFSRFAKNVLGDAALGAEISAGHELGRQVADGKYTVKNIGKAAGWGGLTFATLGVAGRGAEKLIGLGLKEAGQAAGELGGEYTHIYNAGKAVRAARKNVSNFEAANATALNQFRQAEGAALSANLHLANANARLARAQSSAASYGLNPPASVVNEVNVWQQTVQAAQRQKLHADLILNSARNATRNERAALTSLENTLTTAVNDSRSAIRAITGSIGQRMVARGAGMVMGGGAGYLYGGDTKWMIVGAVGGTLIARPLMRRAAAGAGTSWVGEKLLEPTMRGIGRAGKGIAKTYMAEVSGMGEVSARGIGAFALKYPIIKMTTEDITDTKEALSDENGAQMEEDLRAGFEDSGLDGPVIDAQVDSAMKQRNLLRRFVPDSPLDFSAVSKFSQVFDTLNNPQKILGRMATFDLRETDIVIMEELNPTQLKIWRDAARHILKNADVIKITPKQRKMYEMLVGGKEQSRYLKKGANINRLAFGSPQEAEKGSSMDAPAQLSNMQRIEQKGLGSKMT